MKKNDIIAILILGEIIAIFLVFVLKNLGYFFSWLWILLFILPVFALIALFFAYAVGKKILVLFQFAKFVLVGFANTAVDFGILNFLILLTGLSSGLAYSLFKAVSFIGATTHSYFWNKFWTFRKTNTVQEGKEFLQFLAVSIVGLVINVGIASLVVVFVGPQWGLSSKIWANIGAACGSASGLIWNFLGYKFIVFKK